MVRAESLEPGEVLDYNRLVMPGLFKISLNLTDNDYDRAMEKYLVNLEMIAYHIFPVPNIMQVLGYEMSEKIEKESGSE